jgi:hypothetical protein
VAAATLASLAVLALAGCSQPTTDANQRPASSTTTASAPETTPTEKVTPTEPAEPTTTSAAPTPTETATTEAATGGLSGRLLAAADVPGFNDEFRWKAGATDDREPRALFGTCQRFAITSVGATDVAHRTFLPAGPGAGPDTAGELVAEFPDTATARRAFAVLRSWRQQCADRLPARGKVGELQDVSVDGGTGGWYLLTYPAKGNADDAYFDAQGMTVVGTRIAMVSMRLLGQDYDYEPGQEPMVAALQHAAARLP